VPKFRPDLQQIDLYVPGMAIEQVTTDLGLADVVKIASNEHPEPPFPAVLEAIAAAAANANRYPEDSSQHLRDALADRHGISPREILVAAGSSQLLSCIALAMGSPGTAAVFADPSFGLYPIATAVAGARAVAVPTDDHLRLDLNAMAAAVTEETTVVYVCNPNNPTGTHVTAAAVDDFVLGISPNVLIVFDEAYGNYATALDFATAIPHALERDNVVVLRTFSKIYGLAGLRVGYGVGQSSTLDALSRIQAPFSVSSVAQAAALAALNDEDEYLRRVRHNALERQRLETELSARGLDFAPSQANFVLFDPGTDPGTFAQALLRDGVIVRSLGRWVRVTVGTPDESRRFLSAVDKEIAASS
jgi:histidinol-phosphate aminotransferase